MLGRRRMAHAQALVAHSTAPERNIICIAHAYVALVMFFQKSPPTPETNTGCGRSCGSELSDTYGPTPLSLAALQLALQTSWDVSPQSPEQRRLCLRATTSAFLGAQQGMRNGRTPVNHPLWFPLWDSQVRCLIPYFSHQQVSPRFHFA